MDSDLPPAWVQGGDPRFLLGTDDQGRDIFSAVIFGMQVSLAIGLASVALSVVMGVGLGLLSGYVGGRLDAFIMRVCDVMLSFPAILVALLIDGVARYSCLTLALEADGKNVTTVEGLMEGEELGPVQKAFVEEDAYQCGYCTPGQVMAAEGLLRENPAPALDEIRHGMSGNLCRCGAYAHIFKAVDKAARLRKER